MFIPTLWVVMSKKEGSLIRLLIQTSFELPICATHRRQGWERNGNQCGGLAGGGSRPARSAT